MSKKGGIIAFVVVFCLLMLSPFLVNAAAASSAPELSLDTEAINSLSESERECIADTDYMRDNHMQLLDEWRNEVVRTGEREYASDSGLVYDKSLDGTCLNCHSNREEFCDECHDYVGVEPYCWNCHDGSSN